MADFQVPALSALSHVPPLSNPIVIADLHLDVHKPKTIMGFLRFMKNIARRYAELVMIGDLFDQWVGDDANDADDLIAAELTLHTSTGRRVLIMRGESDILLGHSFAQKCGAELIDDPIVIDVANRPILFSHGDLWCTGNYALQMMRNKIREPDWQREILRHSPDDRREIIAHLYELCVKEAEMAGLPIGDERISERAIAEAARSMAVDVVIHAHTMHPGARVNGLIERWVVPNWDLDNPNEGSARSGYISFRENGTPQIQMI